MAPQKPTFSMRIVKPFVELLRRGGWPPASLRFLDRLDLDARISVDMALEMLEFAVRTSGDPDLGLRAAAEPSPADALLEPVVSACATLGDALLVVQRCFHLLNSAEELSIRRVGGSVFIEIDGAIPGKGRAPRDFLLATLYRTYRRWTGPESKGPTVCFAYPEPRSLRQHHMLFDRVTALRFSAPTDALVLEREDLERALLCAQPERRAAVLRDIDARLAEHPKAPTWSETVRTLILEELRGGNPSADHIATRIGVSRRTLTRRLEDEGTSFKSLLGDVRCGLALRYLIDDRLDVAEIVDRLGYSEAAAFHKAFKRWFGTTPIRFRSDHRPIQLDLDS